MLTCQHIDIKPRSFIFRIFNLNGIFNHPHNKITIYSLVQKVSFVMFNRIYTIKNIKEITVTFNVRKEKWWWPVCNYLLLSFINFVDWIHCVRTANKYGNRFRNYFLSAMNVFTIYYLLFNLFIWDLDFMCCGV